MSRKKQSHCVPLILALSVYYVSQELTPDRTIAVILAVFNIMSSQASLKVDLELIKVSLDGKTPMFLRNNAIMLIDFLLVAGDDKISR